MLTGKRVYANPELLLEGHAVEVKNSIRYLGVELDRRLSFIAHIATAARKATEVARTIGRLMPNVGGPSNTKRALLGTVVYSKLLYAAPVWAERGTKTAKNRAAMLRA